MIIYLYNYNILHQLQTYLFWLSSLQYFMQIIPWIHIYSLKMYINKSSSSYFKYIHIRKCWPKQGEGKLTIYVRLLRMLACRKWILGGHFFPRVLVKIFSTYFSTHDECRDIFEKFVENVETFIKCRKKSKKLKQAQGKKNCKQISFLQTPTFDTDVHR